ncbi:hypothetical protein ACOSQ4_021027 [Xanthoceras sorbifolium]
MDMWTLSSSTETKGLGLNGVDREHGQVFDGVSEGTSDHELLKEEVVMLCCRHCDLRMDIRRLWDRPKVSWVLEFGGGFSGHGKNLEI